MSTGKWQNIAGSKKFFGHVRMSSISHATQKGFARPKGLTLFSLVFTINVVKVSHKRQPY